MDFTASFLHSFKTVPHLTANLSEAALLGTPYELNPETSDRLMTVYSRSIVHAGYPFYYEINGLDCYCFLYTVSGTGKFTNSKEHLSFSLSPASLLFFDCRQPFTIETAAAPWEFRILYVNGGNLSFYMERTSPSGYMLENVSTKDSLFSLHTLFQGNTGSDLLYKIADEKILTDLCVTFLSAFLTKDVTQEYIPGYLSEMKQLFDLHYDKGYSLDDLENRFGISKFRLCREFTNHFHESPIQYLNRVRIENAKQLLQNTNLKIHEIGTKVGIENTNHFINLFKKSEGTTPLLYRKVVAQQRQL